MTLPDRIPVFLLSGFLGSGKSTLLNSLLTDPMFADTAVIINEFGDVPVDHLLVRQGETAISQVSTGCLCCSGTTDLRSTLFDLHCAASGGLTSGFSRVIVEMSGLGDPAPLVNALMAQQVPSRSLREETVNTTFHLAGFVTLYDIVTGAISVERHFEALKQIAFADRIVLTKTDLAKDPATKADVAALPTELHILNASAEIVDCCDARLADLFSPRAYCAVERGEDVSGWLALEAALVAETRGMSSPHATNSAARHGPGIRTFSIVAAKPMPEKRFHQFLAVLQSAAGSRLLRVKGIIATDENPDSPMIVHAVQHVVSEPVRLQSWPDNDRRTRIVFITSGIDPKPVRDLFNAAIHGSDTPFSDLFKKLARAFGTPFSEVFRWVNKIQRRSI